MEYSSNYLYGLSDWQNQVVKGLHGAHGRSYFFSGPGDC